MFDLEKAIAAWRHQFKYSRVFHREDLDELERHIRDQVAYLVRSGQVEEAAFREAIREMGGLRDAEEEYRKVYWKKRQGKHALIHELLWGLVMLTNYLKIALRNLRKHKGYSIINITGLAVGLACFLLIYLYVQDELSYDRYHENTDRIYRLVSDLKTPDRTFQFAVTPPDMAPTLRQDFPEIQNTVRFSSTGGLMQYGEKRFQENRVFLADSSVFDVFDFPLLQGDPRTALTEPFSMVITEAIALKYFGDEDPMGKTIIVSGIDQPYTITGILAEIPANSHFTFDILVSYTTREFFRGPQAGPQWFNFGFYTYLLLPEGYDPAGLEAQLPDFVERNIGEVQRQAGQSHTLFLQPLTEIYLRSDREAEAGSNGHLSYIYIFSAIAIFIIFIACINFMNLATARSAARAREVGMRKVVGAQRWQLAGQFLGESILFTGFAFLLTVLLCRLLLPAFNELTGKMLSFDLLYQGSYGFLLLGLVLFVGILAGSYPALVLSGFRPAAVLKGSFQSTKQGTLLRKGLTVFQFMISIVLIVGTLVIHAQLKYLRQQHLGYDEAQMLVINFRGDPTVQQHYERIKRAYLNLPAVIGATTSRTTPDATPGNLYAQFETASGEMQNSSLHYYAVDYDFLRTYGLEMVEGRPFSEAFSTDSTEAFIINEAAVPYFGWASPEAALGKRLRQFGKEGPIIGVVKNFHFRSLHRQVEPLALQIRRRSLARFSLRLKPGENLIDTVADLEKIWHTLVPHLPFEYTFLDESLDQQYRTEARVGQVFDVFAALAIFIACLGLFGLASFTAEQQKKAVGIRKVFGATVTQLTFLLSGRFTRLVFVAFVLAVPVAYFAMNAWLEGFPYRIALSAWPFLAAGVLTLFITWLTVSYQSIKTALNNPVETLRYE